MTTAKVDGITYLIASGGKVQGLSVYQGSEEGKLANVFKVADEPQLGLVAPTGLTAFTLEGESFVAISAYGDAALSIFKVGAGGPLPPTSRSEQVPFVQTVHTVLTHLPSSPSAAAASTERHEKAYGLPQVCRRSSAFGGHAPDRASPRR